MLPRRTRRLIRRVLEASGLRRGNAFGHVPISSTESKALSTAWKDPRLPQRQRKVYDRALDDMRAGSPPRSFEVAGEAIRLCGISEPSILEVGCGSGYYSESLRHMVSARIRYVGLDFSFPMISLATQRHRASGTFCVGDATLLPFPSGSFDVALSGGVLLHVVAYRRAIAETRRVANHWAVFHVVPCVEEGDTLVVKKSAYGLPVMEVIFNLAELKLSLEESGLAVRASHIIEPYPVRILQERAYLMTFACEVRK